MLENLVIQLHDLTLMVKFNGVNSLENVHQMVKRNAQRIVDNNPDQGASWFAAQFISEMIMDSRFTDVCVMVRFEAVSHVTGDIMSVNFEHGDLRVCTICPVRD